MNKLETYLAALGEPTPEFLHTLEILWEDYRNIQSKLLDIALGSTQSNNPVSPERLQELRNKFVHGVLTPEEAVELDQVLNERKQWAEAAGKLTIVAAILILLGMLTTYKEPRKKRKRRLSIKRFFTVPKLYSIKRRLHSTVNYKSVQYISN